MSFDEDLDQFFGATREFGNDVAVYGATTWYGILDLGYAEAAEQAGYAPEFTCATADIPGAVIAGTQITVNGTYYKVKVKRPELDGGVTVLELRNNTA